MAQGICHNMVALTAGQRKPAHRARRARIDTNADVKTHSTRGVFRSSLYLIPILLSLIIPLSFGLRDILCLESAKL